MQDLDFTCMEKYQLDKITKLGQNKGLIIYRVLRCLYLVISARIWQSI